LPEYFQNFPDLFIVFSTSHITIKACNGTDMLQICLDNFQVGRIRSVFYCLQLLWMKPQSWPILANPMQKKC